MTDPFASAAARATHSYARLLGTVDQGSATGTPSFEAACALEQMLADLALLPGPIRDDIRPALAAFRSLLADPAGRPASGRASAGGAIGSTQPARFAPPPELLTSWLAAAAAELSPVARRDFLASPGLGPRWADCLAPNPIDFDRYEQAAVSAARADPPGSCLVVGIRTAGSYLAPLWTRALRSLGWNASYTTARPTRRSGAKAVVTDVLALDEHDVPVDVILVDDGLYSGYSLELVADWILGQLAGRDVRLRSSVYFIGDHKAWARRSGRWRSSLIVMSGCHRAIPFLDGSPARDFFAAALDRLGSHRLVGAEDDVRPCPPSYWQSYQLARVDVPQHIVDGIDHRIRKRRYRLTAVNRDGGQCELVAKYLGWGPLVEDEVQYLRSHWYGDSLLGAACGYLICRWLPGLTTHFRTGSARTGADIEQLALNGAKLWRLRLQRDASAEEWLLRRGRTVEAWRSLSSEVSDALSRVTRGPYAFPVISVPRNQGYWHYARIENSGELRRFHQDVGRWSKQVDPAWDLASAIVELGLDRTQSAYLAASYRMETGDATVESRLPLAVAEYGLSVLADFLEHERDTAGVPARFRRGRRDLLAPFAERVQGALEAVGPWIGLDSELRLSLPAAVAEGLMPTQ